MVRGMRDVHPQSVALFRHLRQMRLPHKGAEVHQVRARLEAEGSEASSEDMSEVLLALCHVHAREERNDEEGGEGMSDFRVVVDQVGGARVVEEAFDTRREADAFADSMMADGGVLDGSGLGAVTVGVMEQCNGTWTVASRRLVRCRRRRSPNGCSASSRTRGRGAPRPACASRRACSKPSPISTAAGWRRAGASAF